MQGSAPAVISLVQEVVRAVSRTEMPTQKFQNEDACLFFVLPLQNPIVLFMPVERGRLICRVGDPMDYGPAIIVDGTNARRMRRMDHL